MDKELLKLEEVAVLIGSSGKSINTWYIFKRENPDNEFAQMLPNYEQMGTKGTRYWHKSDLWKLIQFKNSIPKGRGGVMGNVTQKYYRKKREREENEQA